MPILQSLLSLILVFPVVIFFILDLEAQPLLGPTISIEIGSISFKRDLIDFWLILIGLTSFPMLKSSILQGFTQTTAPLFSIHRLIIPLLKPLSLNP